MPEIILLRHGKSDWGASFDRDPDRPLSRRGRGAAAVMGRLLSAIGARPDLVVTSPALRARATAELASEAGDWRAPIEVADTLYGGGPDAVLGLLRTLDGSLDRVVLVGHEPTWSELASRLIGGGDLRVPTAAAVGLECATPWSTIGPGTCRLVWLLPPRLFARLLGDR